MEIKIKTNSSDAIQDLMDLQKEMHKTNSVITTTNSSSEKSFNRFNNTIAVTNARSNQFRNTIALITNQANIMSRSMMAITQGMAMSMVKIDSQITSIIGATQTMTAYTQAISENTLQLLQNIAKIGEYTTATKKNSDETVNNANETERLNAFQITLGITQGILAGMTAVNTMMTFLKNKGDMKGIALSPKKVLANKKEAAAKGVNAKAGLAAIMTSAPVVGIALGVAALAAIAAGTILINSKVPAMATGGVVSAPTFALVGEGRYPEAVVPLGESPQFASMKADIANAVLQGISASNGVSRSNAANKNLTIQLNIDGKQFAEATVSDIVDTLNNEGYSVLRADAIYR